MTRSAFVFYLIHPTFVISFFSQCKARLHVIDFLMSNPLPPYLMAHLYLTLHLLTQPALPAFPFPPIRVHLPKAPFKILGGTWTN